MPGSFHGIETASRALRAFQRRLDTIGQNVANVDTPGYTRQAVELKATTPLDVRQGSAIALGTGVQIGSINRIRSQYLADQRDLGQAELGRLDGGSQGLASIEGAMLDASGKGIAGALDRFYAGWSALASNPSDAGAKLEVQTAGRALAALVRGIAGSVSTARTQGRADAAEALTQARGLTSQIAELNTAIVSAQAKGASPNDLMDARDGAVRQLAGLMGTTSVANADGSVSVSLDGTTLVDAAGARPFPGTWDPATSTLTDGTRTLAVRGGTLKGLAEAETVAAGLAGRLDLFANTLRTDVNALHASAPGNRPFFAEPTAPAVTTTAATLRLDAPIEADATLIAAGVSGAAGDGSLALGLSRLKDSPSAALGGKTLGAFGNAIVTDAGRASKARTDGLDTQSAINAQLDGRIAEISGVSVDGEMTDMLRTQRSYQAAAKVLTMFDENVSTLIGMLNR